MIWESIELKELRVFFALAEELHFGRSAERLGLTPSRVSQILRGLERKLGGQLLLRTSRRVSLTSFGERFLAESRPAYQRLVQVFEHAYAGNQGIEGTLRLGLLAANSGGPHLTAIIEAFERQHPGCEIDVTEVFHTAPLEPLRRGEIDLMATPLPIRRSDLAVGPILTAEPRVLAVAHDHPLANRESVSIEEIADYRVAPITEFPEEMIAAAVPHRTPNGRTVRRLPQLPRTPHEVASLVARGKIVHPTVPSFAEYFGHPQISYIPIEDLPPLMYGLVRRRRSSRTVREFIDFASNVLNSS